MLGVGALLAIYFCHCHCIFFVCFFHFLISIHGTVVGVGVLLAVTLYLVCPIRVVAGVSVSLATHVFVLFTLTWASSKSWCALGCPSFPLSHHFCSPTWDCSQRWYDLGCPPFLLGLSGVVAGVGVPVAIHLCFFVVVVVVVVVSFSFFFFFLIHPCGTVAKAGVPLAVHLFF